MWIRTGLKTRHEQPLRQEETVGKRKIKLTGEQIQALQRFDPEFLEEHLRIKGRATSYETVEKMQKDLDVYLETYNQRRLHRGRGTEGPTRYHVFTAGIPRKRTRKP